MFAEGWTYLQGTPVGQMAGQTHTAATSVLRGQDAIVRKCTINGAVVYSNVDCRKDNPTSRVVEWHDSHGFEAPKAPVESPKPEAADNLQQKAMDKAIDSQVR